MGIGTNLKEILKAKGITVKELSEKSGIPASTIYSIIKRDNNTVQTNILKKLIDTLDISTNDLIGTIEWDVSNVVNLINKALPNDLEKFLSDQMIESEILNSDNPERHHLLIYYYNTLNQIGRNALVDILSNLISLNDEGNNEAAKRVEELTHIDRYKK